MDERHQAKAEGRDPQEIEFIPPSGEGNTLEDGATNPLDTDAGTPEDEGCEDSKVFDV